MIFQKNRFFIDIFLNILGVRRVGMVRRVGTAARYGGQAWRIGVAARDGVVQG